MTNFNIQIISDTVCPVRYLYKPLKKLFPTNKIPVVLCRLPPSIARNSRSPEQLPERYLQPKLESLLPESSISPIPRLEQTRVVQQEVWD